jgi:hypothetical protein
MLLILPQNFQDLIRFHVQVRAEKRKDIRIGVTGDPELLDLTDQSHCRIFRTVRGKVSTPCGEIVLLSHFAWNHGLQGLWREVSSFPN